MSGRPDRRDQPRGSRRARRGDPADRLADDARGRLDRRGAAILARSTPAGCSSSGRRAVQPTFAVTDQNARSVAQLCRRLDGIPLAIELAAARVRALPVEQIAARLDDRFRLLTGGSRAAVARHQTLRATIDWSYDLLTEPERAVLRRLSVFAGGATLEAAESVCAGDPVDSIEVLDVLGRLVEKSLVFTDPTSTEARFRLLETVREYARGRLVEADEGDPTLRRHRDWYLALVDEASAAFFHGPEPVEWLRRLDREHDDLRAALEWCLDQPGEGQSGLRIAAGLWRYWEIRGHLTEGRGWLERMVEAVGGEVVAASRQRAHRRRQPGVHAGRLPGRLDLPRGEPGPPSPDRRSAERRLRGQQPGQHRAAARRSRAGTGAVRGDDRPRPASSATCAARRSGRSTSPTSPRARETSATARALHEEILATIRELGDRWMEAFALDTFARATSRAGDREDGSVAPRRGARDPRGDGRPARRRAGADAPGRPGPVGRRHRPGSGAVPAESRRSARSSVTCPGLASAMEDLAGAVAIDDAEAAARLHGAAESLREAIRAMVPPQAAAAHDQDLADLEARLGSDRFEAARREGRR